MHRPSIIRLAKTTQIGRDSLKCRLVIHERLTSACRSITASGTLSGNSDFDAMKKKNRRA